VFDNGASSFTTGTATTDVSVANGWQIWGGNKLTGTTTLRLHRSIHPWSTTAHENAGNIANGTAPTATGFYRIGGSAYADDFSGVDCFIGDIAVVAMWDRQLSDAEWASLGGGLAVLLALGPIHCWRLDQATIADLVGNADQVAVGGSPDIAGSLSPFPQ
jgi:hypothetical protein